MCWQIQLTGLYVIISDIWAKELGAYSQRKSNNKKQFITDPELVTIFMFGLMKGHQETSKIHEYAFDHLREWFPTLPSYQCFNNRMNRLSNSFVILCERIQQYCESEYKLENKWILDSMPIILAKGSRSFNAKIAKGVADKGFCSSKKMHYHGVKLHTIGSCISGSIPVPFHFTITNAKMHDLPASRKDILDLKDGILLCDKAYWDFALKNKCKQENNLTLLTPIKKPKNGELTDEQISFSKLVSKFRQPIESFFNWINEKTGIQKASKVRSTQGLALHIFGKLAAGILMRVLPTG